MPGEELSPHNRKAEAMKSPDQKRSKSRDEKSSLANPTSSSTTISSTSGVCNLCPPSSPKKKRCKGHRAGRLAKKGKGDKPITDQAEEAIANTTEAVTIEAKTTLDDSCLKTRKDYLAKKAKEEAQQEGRSTIKATKG